MPKGYLVLCYHSVANDEALQEYARLALTAIQGAGGRYLARGMPARTYEAGLNQRTVVIEFDSVEQAIAAHDSPGLRPSKPLVMLRGAMFTSSKGLADAAQPFCVLKGLGYGLLRSRFVPGVSGDTPFPLVLHEQITANVVVHLCPVFQHF